MQRPVLDLDVWIVTLLDFAGPMQAYAIARALWIDDIEAVRVRCNLMTTQGFLTLSTRHWAHYESTGLFDPDADRPAVPGGRSGPDTPKARYGE